MLNKRLQKQRKYILLRNSRKEISTLEYQKADKGKGNYCKKLTFGDRVNVLYLD